MVEKLAKYLVIIPTYNESESIGSLLERLDKVRQQMTNSSIDILVVDDNSPDGTAELVRQMHLDNVDILARPEKAGLGPAYLAGFTWGLAGDFDYFVEMDADGSHLPEELPLLVAASQGSDLVIGSRWVPGGKVINWPLGRQLISKAGTGYASRALNLPYKDLTSGFRIFTRRALEGLPFPEIQSKGYGFQVEMAMRIHDQKLTICEVPITFVERAFGRSKMTKEIVWEAGTKVSLWAWERRFGRKR